MVSEADLDRDGQIRQAEINTMFMCFSTFPVSLGVSPFPISVIALQLENAIRVFTKLRTIIIIQLRPIFTNQSMLYPHLD
jgi:hypothetical protein